MNEEVVCQSIKNCYDLFSSLIMWHQHSPYIIDNISADLEVLFKKIPTTDIDTDWLKIEKRKIIRKDILKLRKLNAERKNVNNNNTNGGGGDDNYYNSFIKASRVKVGKTLE